MKGALLRIIEAWQRNPDRPRGMCLHRPTCSAYGHQAITRHGLLRGGAMTAWRIARCNRCARGARAGTGRDTTARSG
jgi:uncharacterized protein